MTDTTAERIFKKLDSLSSDMGEIRGDIKVIRVDIEHKPTRVEMINEIESRAGKMIKSHEKGCPGSEHSGVYDLRNTPIDPITTNQNITTGSDSSIKISIPLKGKILKYIIYAIIMGTLMAIGRLSGSVLDTSTVLQKQAKELAE